MSELQLGLIGWCVAHGKPYTDDWGFADRPGKAIQLARKAIRALDADLAQELSALIEEHRRFVLVRHHGAHGVLMVDPTLPAESQWISRLPSGTERTLAAFAADADDAISGLLSNCKRADLLRARIVRRALEQERAARRAADRARAREDHAASG
jgi:hypothetical protein